MQLFLHKPSDGHPTGHPTAWKLGARWRQTNHRFSHQHLHLRLSQFSIDNIWIVRNTDQYEIQRKSEPTPRTKSQIPEMSVYPCHSQTLPAPTSRLQSQACLIKNDSHGFTRNQRSPEPIPKHCSCWSKRSHSLPFAKCGIQEFIIQTEIQGNPNRMPTFFVPSRDLPQKPLATEPDQKTSTGGCAMLCLSWLLATSHRNQCLGRQPTETETELGAELLHCALGAEPFSR